jgi:hypothetical protein
MRREQRAGVTRPADSRVDQDRARRLESRAEQFENPVKHDRQVLGCRRFHHSPPLPVRSRSTPAPDARPGYRDARPGPHPRHCADGLVTA